MKMLDFVTSDANDQAAVIESGMTTPVNKNVKVPKLDSLQTAVATELLPVTTTFLDWIWPPEITKAFQQQLQSIIGGQTTPEKAMKEIQTAFDDLVKKGYKFFN